MQAPLLRRLPEPAAAKTARPPSRRGALEAWAPSENGTITITISITTES
jgi:hypothetical protein